MIKLLVKETSDDITRENMKRLQQELSFSQVILMGQWEFITIDFKTAVTHFKHPHGLTFQPKDILQTSLTGTGTLTWNYASFDRTNLDITTSGACSVRAFIGSYVGGGGTL